MQQPVNSPSWSLRTKRLVILASAVFLLLLIWWLSPILPLVIVACVLAYLLAPLVHFIERNILGLPGLRRIQSRGLAVALTFLLLVALFIIVILVVLPVFVGQLEEFGRNLPRLLNNIEIEITRILSEPLSFNGEAILLEGKPIIPLERLLEGTGAQSLNDLLHLENLDISGAAQTFIRSLGSVTGPAFGFLGDAVNTLMNFIFLIVMMFYLMKDGEAFAQRIIDLSPTVLRDDMARMLREMTRVWNAFLRGQLLVSLMTGVLVFFAGLVLGVPNPLILGLFSGVLQLIPNIGPFLAVIPAVFLALVSKSTTLPFLSGAGFALVVVIVWVIIQNFILFVMIPRIMGHNLDLHPFVILLAVIAGASAGGALGVILAVPFVASGRLLSQYIYGKLTETDPFHRPKAGPARPTSSLWQRVSSLINQRIAARRPSQERYAENQ